MRAIQPGKHVQKTFTLSLYLMTVDPMQSASKSRDEKTEESEGPAEKQQPATEREDRCPGVPRTGAKMHYCRD